MVRREDQKTRRKVKNVKAKDMKPTMMEASEMEGSGAIVEDEAGWGKGGVLWLLYWEFFAPFI